MSKVAWPKLMRLGIVQMGLRPDEFWRLTPAELMLLAGAGNDASVAMSREKFAGLAALYPDMAE